MENITYSQIRMRLAKIMKNVFTSSFEKIYTKNCYKFTETQLRKMNSDLSNEIREFTHNVYLNRNYSNKLNALYRSVNVDIICCFYYRYWVVINLLQHSQQISPNEKFAVEEDDEALLYQLLFDVAGL